MKTSDSIAKIAPAFLAAQKNIGAAVKGQKNPFFKSTYADLGDVMEACKEALNENGIAILQPVCSDGENTCVETILLHESGEYFSDKMPIVAKEPNNPQAQGSAITYARRYSLQSMLFIPAEDDDGNHANGAKSSQEPQRTAQPAKLANKPTSEKPAPIQASGDIPSQATLKKQFEDLKMLAKDGTSVTWPQFVAKALEKRAVEAAKILDSRDLEYGECQRINALIQQYRNNATQTVANVA